MSLNELYHILCEMNNIKLIKTGCEMGKEHFEGYFLRLQCKSCTQTSLFCRFTSHPCFAKVIDRTGQGKLSEINETIKRSNVGMASLKERLKAGERLIGTMINCIDTLDIVSIFRSCGSDYVLIDNEHGCWTTPKISDMIQLCNEMGMGCIVRIPEPSRPYIQKYLDAGADGIMVPNCHNADIARAVVRDAMYEPKGTRGVSMMRAHNRYFPVKDPEARKRQMNDDTIIIVQIESPEGLENVDEIMAVDGVDIALIGPNDLSSSLGIMGQYDHPLFTGAVEKVISTAKKYGKWASIQAMNETSMKRYLDDGFQFMLYMNEVTLLLKFKEGVEAFRKYCEKSEQVQ